MKHMISLIALAFLPAATCQDIPPDAECTLHGAYVIITDARGPSCGPSGLDGTQIVDEPVSFPCDTQDDLGTVCLPAGAGEPTALCYGVLEAGGCTYDVLTVRED
jgi:hypothetical protein